MATFTSWLKEQEGRENDPVGWFAQFWRDLDGKPRLSAPASITKHLEDRDLFRLTPGLTEAHDATLAEYRKQREGVVRAVATEAGVAVPEAQPQHPTGSAQEAQDRMKPPSPAGVIDAAARSALSAAERAVQLDRIEAKLNQVMRHLGIDSEIDREPDAWGNPQGLPSWSWGDLYEQAAVYATARGAGWDQEEA